MWRQTLPTLPSLLNGIHQCLTRSNHTQTTQQWFEFQLNLIHFLSWAYRLKRSVPPATLTKTKLCNSKKKKKRRHRRKIRPFSVILNTSLQHKNLLVEVKFLWAANVYKSSWPGDNHVWPTFCQLSDFTTTPLFFHLGLFIQWLWESCVLETLLISKKWSE